MEQPELDNGLLTAEPAEAVLPPDQFVAWVTEARNLAEELPEGKSAEIARQVLDDQSGISLPSGKT